MTPLTAHFCSRPITHRGVVMEECGGREVTTPEIHSILYAMLNIYQHIYILS